MSIKKSDIFFKRNNNFCIHVDLQYSCFKYSSSSLLGGIPGTRLNNMHCLIFLKNVLTEIQSIL